MTGAELIRAIRKLGRRRGVEVRFAARRGKGSHGTLYFGDRKTVVKDRKKELSSGLLADVLRQLGLEPRDLDR
jgi:mRNA interferase HicA